MPADDLGQLLPAVASLGRLVDEQQGWWVRFRDAAGRDRVVLLRTTADDWWSYVSIIWDGDEEAAVDEVVRLLLRASPATVQLLVTHDYSLVESPYVS